MCAHTPITGVYSVSVSSFIRDHVLQAGVQHKLSSSLSACRSTGTDFVPLVAAEILEAC